MKRTLSTEADRGLGSKVPKTAIYIIIKIPKASVFQCDQNILTILWLLLRHENAAFYCPNQSYCLRVWWKHLCKGQQLLCISSSEWVLRMPLPGWNYVLWSFSNFLHIFLTKLGKKLQKDAKMLQKYGKKSTTIKINFLVGCVACA